MSAEQRLPLVVAPEAQTALETLWAAGHAAYVVGGALRDALLGLPSSDWDIATDAQPSRLLELFPDGSYENRFGTVRVGRLEITTFRRDHRYADHRRPEQVSFSHDVFEDLARRDLTINAIAWGRSRPSDPSRLIDPADGLADLEARLVRAVGDPGTRFDEDALRLLRAIRIAARLGFDIEPLTLDAIRTHAADVAWVSEERVGTELRRMLESGPPSRAFGLLRETGLLAVVLPELDELAGHGARPGAATSDLLRHALTTLDGVVAAGAAPMGAPSSGEPHRTERPGDDEVLALAALLHPVGADGARVALERLHLGGREIEIIVVLVAEMQGDLPAAGSEVEVRRFMQRLGPDRVDALLRLRQVHDRTLGDADALARTLAVAGQVEVQRARRVPLRLADLAIDGRDLREQLGIDEGPLVGEILAALLELVIVDPSAAHRDALLVHARRIVERRARPNGLAPEPQEAPHRVGSAE